MYKSKVSLLKNINNIINFCLLSLLAKLINFLIKKDLVYKKYLSQFRISIF